MKRRIITILFVLVIGLIACTSFASADSTIDYQVYGTQDYAAAQEVLAQLNSLRAQNGLHALTLDPTLTSIAMQRAAECSVKYSHTRPDESNFDSIIRSYSKFTFGYCGENIAAGYRNPTAVMTGWINSQGHYDNMVSPTYYSVGIGCFYQDDGTKYWAQVFHSAKSSSYETNSSPITKNNISIHSATSNCSLYLDGYGDCAVNLYKGMSTQPRLYVKNVGYSYGSAIYLSGGYSLRSQNTAVATTSGYKVTGISPGSTYIDFVFNSGYIPIPYNILATPTLSYSNSNGNIILTLDGYLDNTTNNVSVYYKESNEDVWTLTNINNSNHNYTITNAEYGDTFTCVMRYYDDHLGTWVQVGDSITVKKRLSTPKVNVITLASTGKPKVTWNAVDGADKYEVWRKVGADGTYKKMYVTTKTSYTNKTAIAGTKYYYRVRAIYENNSAGNSLYSSPYAISCDLAAPANVKVITVASTGKPKLTWDSVEGADQYEVWRKVGSNGTYKKYYITTGTTLNNKSAVVGTKYYYKVKAICNSNANANSAFSAAYGVTCDLPAPTSVKVTTVASTGKPKVTWKAVEGADQYEVWRKVGSNGTYKKYYVTTGTTLNNKSAVAGTKYYYKVKAVYNSNTNANSSFSNAYGVTCDLAAPSNVKAATVASTGKPKVTWNAVNGADKYEVWRKVGSNGTYKKMYITTNTSYTNNTAVKGTTYYYKVKAICSSNTNANSAYSAVVSRTAK